MLQNRELTLLNPATWDDKNDRYFMEAFARSNNLQTCLALCFSEAAETYHHWKVFAPGNSGVCIGFDKKLLLDSLKWEMSKWCTHGPVIYQTIPKLISKKVHRFDLPFLKRVAFKDEREYRIVYGSAIAVHQTFAIPLKLSFIRGIYLNPWMPAALFESARATIQLIKGCADLVVGQSSLIDNENWKLYAEKYT